MGLFRKDTRPKSLFGGHLGVHGKQALYDQYKLEPDSSGIDPKRLAAGLLARGEVLKVDPAGWAWDMGPGGLPAPWCYLTVQVHLDGVPPYEATRVQSIPGMQVSQVQTAGAVVAVRVNPDDHADIAVDFTTDPPAAAG